MKILMRQVIIASIIIYSLIYYFITSRAGTLNVNFDDFKEDFFSLKVPEGVYFKDIQSEPWVGYRFGKSKNLSLFYSKNSAGWEKDKLFSYWLAKTGGVRYTKELSYFDGTIFFVARTRNNINRYIYIIKAGHWVFWIENYVKGISFKNHKELVDHLFLTLSIEGQPLPSSARNDIEKIDNEIFNMFNKVEDVLFSIAGIIVLGIFLFYVIIFFSGKIPKKIKENIIRKESHVYYKLYTKLGYKISVGYGILTSKEFVFYSVRRELIKIQANDVENLELKTKWNKSFLFYKGQNIKIAMYFEYPDRWINEIKNYLS